MTLLSDGAFKLYVFLCLCADRSSARLEVDQSNIAKSLAKSRRSVIAYFEELCQQGICEVAFATNQHTRGVVKICDAFWPYVIQMPAGETEGAANYVKHLRMLLGTRSCVVHAFAPADEKLAHSLFFDHVPIEQIERAFLLGCTRKYVSWLNGQISGPIVSLGYFRPIVDEVAQMDTSADYWRYISESLDKYERAWLAQSADGGSGVP
jgi:hypothetical protein